LIRLLIAGEAGHGEAVRVGGNGRCGLQGLVADGSEQNAIERKSVCRGAGKAQVTAMDGVECAAEESYAHSVMLEHIRRYCGVGQFMQRGFFESKPPTVLCSRSPMAERMHEQILDGEGWKWTG
jgi:hypothetical protein